MGLIKKYSDKLFLKQWGIGFMKGSIADIIRNKKTKLSFEWMTLEDKTISEYELSIETYYKSIEQPD
ncbi:MAG: hypothetical protein WDO71_23890 [Bacteroidota bacterium]